MDHSSQNVENEQRVSAQEKSLPQKNEDESKIADKPDWEAEKTTEPRNEVSIIRVAQPYHFGCRLFLDFIRKSTQE